RKRRGSGNNFEVGNLRQKIDNFLRQPIAEVFLLFVAAHVGKRQYGDGRLLVCRSRHGETTQRGFQLGVRCETLRGAFGQTTSHDCQDSLRSTYWGWTVPHRGAEHFGS